MSDDGRQPAVDSVDQIRRHSDPAWRKGIHFYVEPREFTMNPSRGTILPQGHQDIEVTLCSNTVMEFCRRMLVDVEGIGKGAATLVITARCLVPELQVSPYVLQYDECHLKVPYEKKLVIRNPSHLPGCYGLIAQPQSTAEIPVVVEVQALGEHRTSVLIGVFGDERNPLAFSILPLSGVLHPGQSQQVSSTFSGHLSSTSNVTELCHVEGGPTCEVLATGEASGVSSSLSPREISCGSQAPLRERRELKQPAQKPEEEVKALEKEEMRKEDERWKKGKKGVSERKQHPKAEKGKSKPLEKKEAKIPKEKNRSPEKKEKKAAEKKETKAPEKKVTKESERKETKLPEKKEAKAPKKGEAKPQKKGGK
ncbi:hydrocephalus-inducing protein homolog [Haemorhous mexicanus]|uniref:hydrocephalus-inducing protein homolog n=1 Tax=Haemorhous mexicanus TaxID=30427 RepID=UPI0028BF1DCC|nr:hydrocephalus-inducing protein homolog [Haemorhous mexicanus]